MSDNLSLAHKRWLIDYHRKAMEGRRSIEIQVFTGTVILYLVLVNGACEALVGTRGTVATRFVFQGLLVTIFIIFVGFMLQIEIRNRHDRKRYSALERELQSPIVGVEAEDDSENWFKSISRAWAATWPVLTIFVFTVAGILLLQFVPLGGERKPGPATAHASKDTFQPTPAPIPKTGPVPPKLKDELQR